MGVCKKRPLVDLGITGVDAGKTEAPHIEMIEPDTDPGRTKSPHIELIEPENDLNPISAGTETLPELVECQEISTIDTEQDMGIEKEYVTLETAEQIIDPAVTSLEEGELTVTIFSSKTATPEETPGVRRSSQVIFQTKPDYTPSISGNQYETVNTRVECEQTLHPDSHMFSAKN